MTKQAGKARKKSIFQTIFVPLIFVMVFQAVIFYIVAVYGGVEDSLNQNAVDILSERMTNRKNEIETMFNKDWTNLDAANSSLDELYIKYQDMYGDSPFTDNSEVQIKYLNEAVDTLVQTMRTNQVNGIFLILNDKNEKTGYPEGTADKKYGCCIRDMDVTSAYTDREDLLLERMPSSIVDQTGCALDSWWEAMYSFDSYENGKYYYNPINAAWDNPGAMGEDIAYFEGAHKVTASDQDVVSYSIPLLDSNGKPYGVIGVELTTKYLISLLPNKELGDADKTCYVLAVKDDQSKELVPFVGNGSLYNRCFRQFDPISCEIDSKTGGYEAEGSDGSSVYSAMSKLVIYNNNNPFEGEQLVLAAFIEKDTLFYYSHRIKISLLFVSVISLVLGVICIFVVSHRFAYPITTLAKKARNVEPQQDTSLPRLGIEEIDQLVDSIETLNKNVSKETARIEFFSRMSHDMRTPMNAIISFSSREMLDNTDEETKDDYIKKIHTSGKYLLGLINEVLDMTKIESRKVDINYEASPVEGLFDTVTSIVDELAEEKNIKFEKDIRIPEKAFVMVDIQHLNQILINLLSNAVKFTAVDGIVWLKIRAGENSEKKLTFSIIVKDNGVGMSSEFMEKMYQPFEQEHEGQGGTGLGLSISKKLVELMGGTIDCASEKNHGTTFNVCLTFDRAEESASREKTVAGVSKEQGTEILMGKRILMCEDQPLNAQIAKRLLERKGMQVEIAENGREGADRFSASDEGYYDAVLMDIRMPVLDGLGATREIRSQERADAKTIPIIAMTANAFEEDIKMSTEAGMNAHLSKPIEPEKLYGTLAKYLKQNN